MVEHIVHIDGVTGSSPVATTSRTLVNIMFSRVFFLRFLLKSVDVNMANVQTASIWKAGYPRTEKARQRFMGEVCPGMKRIISFYKGDYEDIIG